MIILSDELLERWADGGFDVGRSDDGYPLAAVATLAQELLALRADYRKLAKYTE